MGIPCWSVDQYRKASGVWPQAACVTVSRGYPTLTAVLIEIAFETVHGSSFQCGCFGLLMIQWHTLKGASRFANAIRYMNTDTVGSNMCDHLCLVAGSAFPGLLCWWFC